MTNEPVANEEPLGEAAAADRFKPYGEIAEIREFGGGNINATFLVTLDSGEERRFILQRLNTQVFPRPDRIMRNLRTVSEHVQTRLKSGDPGRRWEMLAPTFVWPLDGGANLRLANFRWPRANLRLATGRRRPSFGHGMAVRTLFGQTASRYG